MLVQKLHLFPIPAMSSSKGPRFVNLNLSSLSVYQLHCACRCHGPLTYHIQSINGGPFTRHHNHIPLTRRFRHGLPVGSMMLSMQMLYSLCLKINNGCKLLSRFRWQSHIINIYFNLLLGCCCPLANLFLYQITNNKAEGSRMVVGLQNLKTAQSLWLFLYYRRITINI